jgi:hypothetical protein
MIQGGPQPDEIFGRRTISTLPEKTTSPRRATAPETAGVRVELRSWYRNCRAFRSAGRLRRMRRNA